MSSVTDGWEAATASRRISTRLWATSRPTYTSRSPSALPPIRRRPGRAASPGSGGWHAVEDHRHRRPPVGPPSGHRPQVVARHHQGGGVAGGPVPHLAHGPQPQRAPGGVLELVEVEGGEPMAPAPLPRRVARHLQHHRAPGQVGAGDGRQFEAGGVHHVEGPAVTGQPPGGGRDPHRPRPPAGEEHQVGAPGRPGPVGEAEHDDVVAAVPQGAGQVGGVGGGAADVGRVDAGDDDHPHEGQR